jgi:hypothetical protein
MLALLDSDLASFCVYVRLLENNDDGDRANPRTQVLHLLILSVSLDIFDYSGFDDTR